MKRIVEADFLPRSAAANLPQSASFTGLAPRQKRRILIVDNDSNTTHLVKILLEKSGGYFVLEENDAGRVLESVRSFRPDLILLDIVMPETDAAEIAAQIQADPELQGTPIIFLTALVTRAEAKGALCIQGHPVLAKPIDIQELVNIIDRHLPERAKRVA